MIAIYGMAAFIFMSIYDFLPSKTQTLYFFLYTSFEYISLAFLISLGIGNKKIKKLILSLSICFFIFHVYFGLTSRGLDSISIGVETILLFVYIFLFFYDHSKNNKTGFIYNHPTFWLCVGILLYLGGSFFFNILANYMPKAEAEFQNYWDYASIAELLKNLFFAVAMLITSHQHKTNSLNQSQVPYLDMDMK